MLENFKEALEKGNSVSAIFMGLFKTFNTLNHDLLIAKVDAHGFSANSVSHIHRLQKTNVSCDFSLWKEIFSGAPQWCVLILILFNIFISDIFFFANEAFASNYANDTAVYSAQKPTSLTNLFLRKNLCNYRNVLC